MTDANQLVSSDELAQKRQFAAALLKTPTEPFKAAILVFNDNVGRAIEVMRRWPDDVQVRAFMQELTDQMGEAHFLPNKNELARQVYEMGADDKAHFDDRLKALKLYAEIRGYIEKQGITVNNNNTVQTNKVMIVKDHGSTESWEQRLAAQQGKLIDDAATSTAARSLN